MQHPGQAAERRKEEAPLSPLRGLIWMKRRGPGACAPGYCLTPLAAASISWQLQAGAGRHHGGRTDRGIGLIDAIAVQGLAPLAIALRRSAAASISWQLQAGAG